MANYVAINGFQYGIEMQLIWDFLNTAKHTLGIHISPPFPLSGIEVMHTFHKHTRNSFDNNWHNETINTTSRWRQIQLSFPMSIGFHYYYDINHQIFVTLKPRFLIYAESYPYYNLDDRHTNSIFTLGYTYKF